MPTPTKKPTLKLLTAELDKSSAEISALRNQLADRDLEIAAHRTTASRHEEEVSVAQAQLATAKSALAPFLKTAKWEQWPPLHVCVCDPLTWGDIKRAADTASALK